MRETETQAGLGSHDLSMLFIVLVVAAVIQV